MGDGRVRCVVVSVGRLISLGLARCHLDDRKVDTLCAALSTNVSLQRLVLSRNPLGAKNVRKLCEALQLGMSRLHTDVPLEVAAELRRASVKYPGSQQRLEHMRTWKGLQSLVLADCDVRGAPDVWLRPAAGHALPALALRACAGGRRFGPACWAVCAARSPQSPISCWCSGIGCAAFPPALHPPPAEPRQEPVDGRAAGAVAGRVAVVVDDYEPEFELRCSCGVWCVVCGVWCVVCGVLCVVCGVWCVVWNLAHS